MASAGTRLAHPERRAAQRFMVSVPVFVQSPDGSFAEETALSHDMSAKGIFFFMNSRPREGSTIEFTVTLPAEVTLSDPMRVNCQGRVIRTVDDEKTERFGVGATIQGYNSFIRLSHFEFYVAPVV